MGSKYLIDCQVYSCIWYDSHEVRRITLVESLETFILQYLSATVKHPFILSRLTNSQSGFHNLQHKKHCVNGDGLKNGQNG